MYVSGFTSINKIRGYNDSLVICLVFTCSDDKCVTFYGRACFLSFLLAMVTADNTLIVTGSADVNVMLCALCGSLRSVGAVVDRITVYTVSVSIEGVLSVSATQ